MGRLKVQLLWTDGTGPVTREEVIETSYPWAYIRNIGGVVENLLVGMLNEAGRAKAERAAQAQMEVGS
jgi:hypothetical protein